MAIQIADATINTATIEVKVMKIGNRQVTLAVFRQLPEEPIIGLQTGELKGVAWGKVNYHVDCEHFKSSHLHVVWQKDDQLRRSIAFLPWNQAGRFDWLPSSFYRDFLAEHSNENFLDGGLTIYDLAKELTKARGDIEVRRNLYEISQKHGFTRIFNQFFKNVAPLQEIWQQSYAQLEQLDQLFIAV